MTVRTWIRKLFARPVSRPIKAPGRFRPGLEALEDRLVPANFTIANGDVAGLIAAIITSNSNNQADTINLAAGGTYTLTSVDNSDLGPTGLPSIVLDGSLANTLTINGNGATIQREPGASTPLFRLFTVDGGTLDLLGTTLANGSSSSVSSFTDGGAIRVEAGVLDLSDCALTSNTAALDGNGFGGGVGVRPGASATITNCTFTGNQAVRGGAVHVEGGSLTLVNCTLAGNSATEAGGGLGQLNDGTLTFTNTLVADNSCPGSPDVSGSLTSQGYNLVGDTAGGQGFVSTDLLNVTPLLGAFQNNSGPTPTMALLPGSPAIDAGTSSGAPTTDQRGVSRVGAVDIGAFESRGFSMTITGGNNQQALVNTAFAVPLSVQLTSSTGEPVQGGVVSFSAPGSGAGAAFSTALPLNAAGQTSVSATANGTAGSYSVSVAASGATTRTFSLSNLPAIVLSPATLPEGTYATAYSQTLTATGGAGGPYTYTVTKVMLPAGLGLSTLGTGVVLRGTPTAAGSFSFTLTATDSRGFTTSQNCTLTIDKVALTITANSTSKTYGQTLTFAGTEFTSSGLVNGDTVSGVTLASAGAAANAGVADSPYAIVASTAVGRGLDNYTISYFAGSLTVNPAALTVTADNQSMTYGGSVPALTYHYIGLVNGDTSASFTGGLTTMAGGHGVGSYPITQGSLAATGNYTIGTFNGGTLTVTQYGFDNGNLIVNGVAGQSNVIVVNSSAHTFTVNGQTQSYNPAALTGHIIVYGVGNVGNNLQILGSVSAEVHAGNGNDTITGGAGDDVIYGGSGNDVIQGGGGNDVLISGTGRSRVSAGAGHNILIGGGESLDYTHLHSVAEYWAANGSITPADLALMAMDFTAPGAGISERLTGGTGATATSPSSANYYLGSAGNPPLFTNFNPSTDQETLL
jgi:hypothetical protein